MTDKIAENVQTQVAEYKRLWPLMPVLHAEIFKLASPADVKVCGKKLRMLDKKGAKVGLHFEHPLEMDMFQDYLFYMYRPHGFSLVRKMMNRKRYPPDSDEQQLLAAMVKARFSVFWIREMHQEGGLIALDVTTGDGFFIFDQSQVGLDLTGALVGMRIFPFLGAWMHTGACIPVGEIDDPAAFRPLNTTLNEVQERALNEQTMFRWRDVIKERV